MISEFKSINPWDLRLIKEYQPHTNNQIQSALDQSGSAFEDYKQFDADNRTEILLKLADLFESEREAGADLMASEMGKPLAQGKAEMDKCALACRHYAESGLEGLAPNISKHESGYLGYRFDPIGPVLTIMPWNYPFWQVTRFFAPNAMLGNPMLLKHAPNVQGCAEFLIELITKAGFNSDFAQNLRIPTNRITDVIKDNRVKGVTLTGSVNAGKAVGQMAGEAIKPCVLELGGSNAFVVMNDANIEKAVDALISSRYGNTGQSCIASKRLLLQDGIKSDFTTLLLDKVNDIMPKNPKVESTFLGPMARTDLAEQLEKQLNESINKGALILHGGSRNDCRFQLTVVGDVTSGMPLFEEESFGPVAAITSFKSLEEGFRLAEQTPFGLGVSLFTNNKETQADWIQQSKQGAVFINDFVQSRPELPFGGTGISGIGRELGMQGLHAFANIKTVSVIHNL